MFGCLHKYETNAKSERMAHDLCVRKAEYNNNINNYKYRRQGDAQITVVREPPNALV